ncbi:SRPBCC domain-containing protein [Candidatus Nitrosocosmicus sp. T]
MVLRFSVQAKINKQIDKVFDAIYNPDKLSKYFTTGGASSPIDEGREIKWRFQESPEEISIFVIQSVKNQRIIFEWNSQAEKNTRILQKIRFEKIANNATRIILSQSGWKTMTQESVDESHISCMGWTQMLCSLKVYLEYGKNLREFFY